MLCTFRPSDVSPTCKGEKRGAWIGIHFLKMLLSLLIDYLLTSIEEVVFQIFPILNPYTDP